MAPYESKRHRAVKRWSALYSERSTWDADYADISRFVLPYAGRFYLQDRNIGGKSFNNILDNSPTRANGVLAAGMMSGNSSPARPWFRLTLSDTKLAERHTVKQWLSDVSDLMRLIFNKSNTYRALHSMYEQLGSFGTACNIIDDDFDSVIWSTPLTIGEFVIATDPKGRVNTMLRQFEMTVAQLVENFVEKRKRSGSLVWDNVSLTVKNFWDKGNFDTWVPVLHSIQPRPMDDREYGAPGARNMPIASCYYELKGTEDKTLRESGYKRFPVLAPRWHTYGRDVMGVGCGHNALGDIKQLQHEQLRKGQAIDYQTLPPVAIPGEFKGRELNTLPGGTNALGIVTQGAKIQNLFDVQLDLQALLADIQDVRERINKAFFADLFLLISNMQSTQPVTAREIAERHEEKLLMLGPVLERLNDEMLSPLIEAAFARMIETGLISKTLPPPPELHGAELQVEFVSVLAQAQRAVGLGAVDRFLGTVALISQGSQDPSVWDKVNKDEVVDRYADMLAVDPSLIVADEKVALVRDQRAKVQQAQQMAAAAPVITQAMKNAAQAHEASPAMMEQTTGYSGAGP